jgi:purine-binding chemotaxis protein CheW
MKNQNEETKRSYLSFKVGTEFFATNVSCVLNILEITKITRVPKSPKFLKGVINLRGNVLPVLDTRIKFGLKETEYTTNTCILILEIKIKNEKVQLGAIVDSVSAVLELADEQIQPAPSLGTSYKTNILKGFTKVDDEFIMIIDPDKVFADEEIIDINNISADVMN